jgi:drug/metabolite transporter (DMT)-like permease
MNWLLQLYPARWRERYGEEFGAVLASQRASVGLVLDVLGGAIDAHLYPQIQQSHSKPIKEKEGDTMTLLMLQRCSAGGPKLSPRDQRIASLVMIFSGLVMASLYIGLTKIYHSAPAVQALFYASVPALALIYGETAYLRKRPWLTQVFILGGGLSGLYLFMLAVCVVSSKL